MKDTVSFCVRGPLISKGNYRWSNTAKGRAGWARVKEWEAKAGWEAKAAGASVRPDCQVHVEITSYGLRNDIDGILKSGLDSLIGVAYPDDSPKHVPDVRVMWRADDGGGKRLEYTLRYVRPAPEEGGRKGV